MDPNLWSGLEQTPAMEATPDQFPEDAEPTGNTTSCYVCARSFQQLPPEYIIRRDYEYDAKLSKGDRPKMRRYFMTFCVWCAHSHKL